MVKNIKEALLIIIAIALVFLSMGLFISKERLGAEKKETTARLNMLRTSLNKLQDDFKNKEKQKEQFKKKLDELSREASTLEVQVSQIEKIHREAGKQLAIIEGILSTSQKQIKQLSAEKKRLKRKLSSVESTVTELEDRLAVLKQTTGALERHHKKVMRISGARTSSISKTGTIPEPAAISSVPPPESSIESSPAPPAEVASLEGPFLVGEVLVVNREFNFVVVNLGIQDGLKEGDLLSVYDGDKLLGKVCVETVRKNISAASGSKDLDAYRIRAGNKVYPVKL